MPGELRKEVNAKLDSHEHLEKLVVTKDEWTIENGLLTPAMKMKRPAIESVYGAHLDRWYSANDDVFFG